MKSAVVALAFGVPASLHSNQCVAEIASVRSLKLCGAPIFTQLDMEMLPGLPIVKMPGEYPGHWANTMQMARAAIAWAQKENVNELWIAAAKPHLRRSLRDFAFAVKESGARIDIHACDEHCMYSNADWFRKESEQQRTRDLLRWLSWDIPLRYMPMRWYLKLTDKPL